jgi:hypothetical protein
VVFFLSQSWEVEMYREEGTGSNAGQKTNETNYNHNPIGDPIGELMEIGSSIKLMQEVFEGRGEYGESQLLRLLGCRVREIAEKLDEETWEVPSQETLEARRKGQQKNAGPDPSAPMKSDEEAISMLQDVFAGDEEQGDSLKRMIDISHHYLMKRQEKAA